MSSLCNGYAENTTYQDFIPLVVGDFLRGYV